MNKQAQGGFTILEAMIGLALAAVLAITAVSLTTLSTQIIGNTKRYLLVNSVAFAKMQEYENKTFDQIAVGTSPSFEVEDFSDELSSSTNPTIKNPVAKVYSEPVSGSLRKIRIKIEYQNGPSTRFIEYATYIQLGGVGR